MSLRAAVATAKSAALLVLGLAFLAPESASSAVSYLPEEILSEAGGNAGAHQLAVDGSGRTTIVWQRYDGANFRVQSVRLASDGTPGAVRTLSPAGASAENPAIAIDGSDRTTIAWRQGEGAGTRIKALRLASDGSPGSAQSLSAADEDAFGPAVAIDSSDRATIVWRQEDGTGTRIQSARLAADGTPDPVQTLSEETEAAFDPALAVDGSDRATIVWSGHDGSEYRVRSVRLAADGAPEPIRTISPVGANGLEPEIAVAESGQATIAWEYAEGVVVLPLAGGSPSAIQAVRLGSDGIPEGAVQTLSSSAAGNAFDPAVAVDVAGRATIAWDGATFGTLDESASRIREVRLAADGTPGSVQTLSATGAGANGAQVAIDDSGRATIAWDRRDGPRRRVQAVRLDAGGTAGQIQDVSTAAASGLTPHVAIGPASRATVAWVRIEPGSTGRIAWSRALIGPPRTAIDSGPHGATADDSPTFRFSSTPDAGFECSLDGAATQSCAPPLTYTALRDGKHRFSVAAVDSDGADPSPAQRAFTVDTRVAGPSVRARKRQEQRGRRVIVRIRAGADERVEISGRGTIRSGTRVFALRATRRSSPAGERRVLRLTPSSRADDRSIRRLLNRGEHLRAKTAATLADPLGNETRRLRAVRLR